MNRYISKTRIYLKKYFPKIYNSTLALRSFIYRKLYLKKSELNIISEFEEFSPNVSGDIDLKIMNTIFNIKNFSTSINNLIDTKPEIKKLNSLSKSDNEQNKLGELFTFYGSDKKALQYDLLYIDIFQNINNFTCLIEIGIGTNNEKVLSNMSEFGSPGASLRAFRDYLKSTNVIGLEFDKEVLFTEDGIDTFHYDQNNEEQVNNLSKKYENSVDVLIDDGLHSIVANINSIKLATNILKPQGYLIIEDINPASIKLYLLAFKLVENIFDYELYTNKSCLVACLRKKS